MVRSQVTNIFNRLKKQAKPQPPIPQLVWQDPIYFIAFGLGSGTIPIAPGTFGTLMTIPFYLMLKPLPLVYYLLIVCCFIVFAMWISDRVSQKINVHDHPGMCIDEFAGFLVTMIHAPNGWLSIVIGFLLFRLFDIWKPWPIDFIDKHIHGGFGMVLDDVIAGLAACAILQIGWL